MMNFGRLALVFLFLLPLVGCQEIVRCMITTCDDIQGCPMRKMNKLKDFVRSVGKWKSHYANLESEFIIGNGKEPEAFFFDKEDELVASEIIPDLGHSEMVDFFKKHKFTLKPNAYFEKKGQPTDSWEFDGHRYELYTKPAFFSQLQEYIAAKKAGGYILTVNSEEEFANVVSHFPKDKPNFSVYLGAQDSAKEGEWKWLAGPEEDSVLVFAKWAAGEPNNATPDGEHCAVMAKSGYSDVGCHWKMSFIIEYPLAKTEL